MIIIKTNINTNRSAHNNKTNICHASDAQMSNWNSYFEYIKIHFLKASLLPAIASFATG